MTRFDFAESGSGISSPSVVGMICQDKPNLEPAAHDRSDYLGLRELLLGLCTYWMPLLKLNIDLLRKFGNCIEYPATCVCLTSITQIA